MNSITLERSPWATGAYLALIALSFRFHGQSRKKRVRKAGWTSEPGSCGRA
ncbi:MAG: hypothetical protein IPI61_10145 [Syntrophaceae bacterium]|nr:hypothetical protein [Syntrophaceae bacterium]